VPATMAMGFGMAQEMMKGMSQSPAAPGTAAAPPAGGLDVLTPEQAAQALGVSVEDVMASITAGDLKARKIGSAWRIARASLEEFLKG
jgi:excisionase family DNA binding protein